MGHWGSRSIDALLLLLFAHLLAGAGPSTSPASAPAPVPASVRPSAPTPDALLTQADRARDSFPEATVHARISALQGGKEAPVAELELTRKGPDRMLIELTSGKLKGRRVLVVGDKVWLIVPGTKRAVPISASQRLVSGVAIGDLSRIRFADYTATPSGTEVIDGRLCEVLSLQAKQPATLYPRGTVWIDREEHLARRARFLLSSSKPAREVWFEAYDRQAGSIVVRRMRVIDLLSTRDDRETRIEFSEYRAVSVPDARFTPEGARG